MPPSSSISSFRTRRGAVAITAFALAFAAILASSAWRLDDRGVARTREDQLVHAVSKMRDVRARAIILGDSVTQVAAYSFKPAPAVYSLLTNGYLRLAGNYLLFRRFIEHNATKSMYLFVVPSLLSIDVSDTEGGGLARYTYVDSVFTRPEEVKILAEAGATPKRKIVSSFERLLKSWYPNNFSNPFGIGPFGVVPTDRLPQRYEGKRIPPWTTPQVRYFLAAAREGNLTRAARSCGVRQPTISQSLKELEAALGGALFRRAHHGVALTPLGRAVRPHLAAIARAAVKAGQTAQAFCGASKGRGMGDGAALAIVTGGDRAGVAG